MKVHTSVRKAAWVGLAIMAMILAGGTQSTARLIGDTPTAQLVLPALAHNSQIRLTGTLTLPVNRDFPLEDISIRLILMREGGVAEFGVERELVPNKNRPNEAYFSLVIPLGETGFFAPGEIGSGAVVVEMEELLGPARKNRGKLNWTAYIEQDTLNPQQPLIAAYCVQLLDKGFD